MQVTERIRYIDGQHYDFWGEGTNITVKAVHPQDAFLEALVMLSAVIWPLAGCLLFLVVMLGDPRNDWFHVPALMVLAVSFAMHFFYLRAAWKRAGRAKPVRRSLLDRYHADAEDSAWCRNVEADGQRALRELEAGRDATLRAWSLNVGTPYNGYHATWERESFHEFRWQRRRECLTRVQSNVERRTLELHRLRQDQKAEEQRLREAQERERRELAEQAQQAVVRLEAYNAQRHLELIDRSWTERSEQEFKKFISAPIPLGLAKQGIIFGTEVEARATLVMPVSQIPHLLIAGTSGFGKSVFLHQLVYQLMLSSAVERLFLVDLKEGVEFQRYASDGSKVHVVGSFDGTVEAVKELVRIMQERLTWMRANGVRTWAGGAPGVRGGRVRPGAVVAREN
jgi:hypothetical protein